MFKITLPEYAPPHPVHLSRITAAVRSILLIGLLVLSQAAPLLAQQGEQIAQLRAQVAALEAVEDDAATPVEVRRVNQKFLAERRARLRTLLKTQADELMKYLAVTGANLSAQEREKVEKTVRELQAEYLGNQVAPPSDAATSMTMPAHLITRFTPVAESAEKQPTLPRAPLNNSPTGAADEAVMSSTPVTQGAQNISDCYPDAPPALIQTAQDTAQLIVQDGDPTLVTAEFFKLMFIGIAHVVSVDAKDSFSPEDERRTLINRINFARAKTETKRTDKQIGASARSEGSTSAADKPGFAELLGFAIEHGAIQQENNGTSLTLSTSPYALFARGQEDTSTAYQNYGYLSRVGISANFNLFDQDNPLTSARRNQLNDWSVRARLSGDRSARSRSAEQIWEEVRSNFVQPVLVIQNEMVKTFQSDPTLDAKRREIAGQFTAAPFQKEIQEVLVNAPADQKINRIAGLIVCQVRREVFNQVRSGAFNIDQTMRTRILDSTLPQLQTAIQARAGAVNRFEAMLEELSYKPEWTLAYTNKREASGSDYSMLRMLFQKKSREGLNVIGNAGFSLYHRHDELLNQQRIRDIAAALSFEGTMGRSPFLLEGEDESRVIFSFTGSYQRMFENRGIAGKKADIGVAQFKVELPLFTGMSLPFSITYANATETVKEDHVRANFGFTIDTDKILQIIRLRNLK